MVTFYGHSCFAVETGGARLLFDPFVSPNPKAAGIDIGALEADYVLISHGHGDHVADAEPVLKRTGAVLVANFEVVNWFQALGVADAHPMNHGGAWEFPFGRVKFVSAVHSSTMPDGQPGGNPGGFVVRSDEGTFYYSGDTALHFDMKLIADEFRLDWAALCIGDNFTMGYRDAARAAEWVGAPRVLGVHYDTFPPIEIDHAAARAAFEEAGRELVLAPVGATVEM